MGVDLKLINALWVSAKEAFGDEWVKAGGSPKARVIREMRREKIPYTAILYAGIALLKDKALAQRFLDETWEGLDDANEVHRSDQPDRA